MKLVLPINPSEYIHILGTEDYITQSRIFSRIFLSKNLNLKRQNELVHGNNALVLSLGDSLNLDKTLTNGILEEISVEDGAGKVILPERLTQIFDERHAIGKVYRGEALDAVFGDGNVRYHVFSPEGIKQITECLDSNTLMLNKRIDLVHFIREAHTSDGLPRKDVKEGDFYYWFPISGAVAWLYACSDRAFLGCYRGQSNSYSGLRVRAKISTGNLKHFLQELRDKYKVPEKKKYYTRERILEQLKI